MPATTGVSAVPMNRPAVEAQSAIAPAYFLSDSARREPGGSVTRQISALFEPDRMLGTRGLVVGLRRWGQPGDAGLQPMLGYRRRFDGNGSLAVIGYATHLSGANTGAWYEGTHAGGELSFDAKILGGSWLAAHLQVTGSLTYLAVNGSYCVGREGGYGVDCDDDGRDHRVDAHLTGLFPAATASLALDIARRPTGVFHGVRLAFLVTYGAMPVIRYLADYATIEYSSVGLSLTLGFGAGS